jgi:hypothetical protein
VKERSSYFLKKGGASPAGTKKLLMILSTPSKTKSFLLLFFKKEVLACLHPIAPAGPASAGIRCEARDGEAGLFSRPI